MSYQSALQCISNSAIPLKRADLVCIIVSALIAFPTLSANAEIVSDIIVKQGLALEIDDQGEVVWKIERLTDPCSVEQLPDGTRLIADSLGEIIIQSAEGRTLQTLPVPGVEDARLLRNGNVLVALYEDGIARELDTEGRTVWEYQAPNALRGIQRLESGATLICETEGSRVIEVDASGERLWEFSRFLKRPWDLISTGTDSMVIADIDDHSILSVRRDGDIAWRLRHIRRPCGIASLPNGGFLVCTDKGGHLLYVRDGRVVKTCSLNCDIRDISLSAAGNLLLAVGPTNDGSPLPIPIDIVDFIRIAKEGAISHPAASRSLFPLILLGAVILVTMVLLRRSSSSNRRFLIPLLIIFLFVVAGITMRLYCLPGVKGGSDIRSRSAKPRNIVIILMDSLRKDHLAIYGYPRHTAPSVENLAKEGLVFEQYIVQAPWTKPSIASLFTSTYPTNHGVVDEGAEWALPQKLVTLAEVLADKGYYTAAITENPYMNHEGFNQGFSEFHSLTGGQLPRDRDSCALMGDKTLEILHTLPEDRPFFLFLFFINPHTPYSPTEEITFEEAPYAPEYSDNYDGEILLADRQIGRIIDSLESRTLLNDTVVVFSTDHGEEMDDHGEMFHGLTLYDSVLNVPLVIWGSPYQGRFKGLVREIDLMPTLLEFLGIEPDSSLHQQIGGQSVKQFISRGVASTGLVAYSETCFQGVDKISCRDEHKKVIVDFINGESKTYEIDRDPGELNERVSAEVDSLAEWRRNQWTADRERAKKPIPLEEIEQLKGLGYMR